MSNFEASRSRIISQLKAMGETIPKISFLEVDLDRGVESLVESIQTCGVSCVVHTAGPFQQRTKPILAEAAIACKVSYVDVCDEIELCKASKKLQSRAEASGSVVVIAGGIWPGVSSLMAAQAIDELRAIGSDRKSEKIDMSFFTAGTGNAGATIVSATFLLLCQPALTFQGGVESLKEPWSEPRKIAFAGVEGMKTVRLLDNPDVFTLHAALGVPFVESRFGTAPALWNWLFGAMRAIVPPTVLSNRSLMQTLSIFSLPVIRAVDALVGATNAMVVECTSAQGTRVRYRVTHADLEQCVGLATAAFALQIIENSAIKPGVYFPAELPVSAREAILGDVKRDAIAWEFEVLNHAINEDRAHN